MTLGERMKEYEMQSRTRLLRKVPVIIRLDGKAFHTWTRGLDRPFDRNLMHIMQKTMLALCEQIQGCVLGYTQSDEITLVLVDYDGMFVPAMRGKMARELGSPDFRHPLRKENVFDQRIDDFPAMSILVSLIGISKYPDLFLRYGAPDRLLLHEYHSEDRYSSL